MMPPIIASACCRSFMCLSRRKSRGKQIHEKLTVPLLNTLRTKRAGVGGGREAHLRRQVGSEFFFCLFVSCVRSPEILPTRLSSCRHVSLSLEREGDADSLCDHLPATTPLAVRLRNVFPTYELSGMPTGFNAMNLRSSVFPFLHSAVASTALLTPVSSPPRNNLDVLPTRREFNIWSTRYRIYLFQLLADS